MQYWLWVAKSEAETGNIGENDLYWGDCGKNVEPGDFALIYRKSPVTRGYMLDIYSRIEGLACIKSFPEKCKVKKENNVPKTGFCCEYELLFKFDNGLTYKEMIIYKDGSIISPLNDWVALKQNFHKMYFPIDQYSWNELNRLLNEKNQSYKISNFERIN